MWASASSAMYFKQFYLGCLAHASYLIGDSGEAAVVDPQRDVEQYLDEAARENLCIKYVIETHLHADFVSGHRELADRSGAQIVIGAEAKAAFPHIAVREGNTLAVGNIELRAIETPGHTPESICWLLIENGVAAKLLTGDRRAAPDELRVAADVARRICHAHDNRFSRRAEVLFARCGNQPARRANARGNQRRAAVA